MVKESIKASSGDATINFGVPLLAVDGEPFTEVDRKTNKEVPMTVGRVLGNLLYNYRPQPDPQRGVGVENFDAIRSAELGMKIYRAKDDVLTAGEIDYILEVISKVPFTNTGVEYQVKKTLKDARATIK